MQGQQTRIINNLGLTAPPARRLWPRRCILHNHVQQSTVRVSNIRAVAHSRSTVPMASANPDHCVQLDLSRGILAAMPGRRAPVGVRPEYPGGLPPPQVHCSLDSTGLRVMDLRVMDLPLLFQGFRVSDRRQCADTSCMCSSCPVFCSWKRTSNGQVHCLTHSNRPAPPQLTWGGGAEALLVAESFKRTHIQDVVQCGED